MTFFTLKSDTFIFSLGRTRGITALLSSFFFLADQQGGRGGGSKQTFNAIKLRRCCAGGEHIRLHLDHAKQTMSAKVAF